ncbi:MAG: TRAM domain-containing protein [Phycisphaerales bacterium]|nr:TRAM domain-containing protein [Phycisphaerales bacterium]
MLLNMLRAIFVLAVVAVAMNFAETYFQNWNVFEVLLIFIGISLFVIGVDILVAHKSLLAISGLFFGLLVGMVIAYGVGLIFDLLVDAYREPLSGYFNVGVTELTQLASTVKILLGAICCYLAVSFILQTKDDVRFVIPYVEFAKQRKGQRTLILDTSVIIDGRIVDILQTWGPDAPVSIPRFVLAELQGIADSGDKLKRKRGRRGLDVVNKLQTLEKIELEFQDVRLSSEEAAEPVDQRLVTLAQKINGRIVTNDYNLNKMAQIRGIDVININDLANALKPVFLPGESMQVKIIKPGEESGQGIGYLDDGTMVVVESAADRIGETVRVGVTSVLQTSAGRMVFGRHEGSSLSDRQRRKPNMDS